MALSEAYKGYPYNAQEQPNDCSWGAGLLAQKCPES